MGEAHLGCDDLLGSSLDSHVEEQDDQDGDDRYGNQSPHRGLVVRVSVVPQELGVGEEVKLPDHLAEEFDDRHLFSV